jgi:hypothetical protein
MCSGWVCSSCSTSDTRRVNLVTNPVISPYVRNVKILSPFSYFCKSCLYFLDIKCIFVEGRMFYAKEKNFIKDKYDISIFSNSNEPHM